MKIDLDAARAARREASGEGPVVVIGGKELQLPAELPFEVVESLTGLDTAGIGENAAVLSAGVTKALQGVLGEHYDEFMATRPSLPDVEGLIEGLVKAYGLEDLGESPASAAS